MTEAPAHEVAGYRIEPWPTSVTAERQARYHAAAKVESALYGDALDASVLSNDCLHGARPRDALGAVRLHAGVHVRQHRPVPLGTPLTVQATVAALVPHRRGRMILTDFAFEEAPGDAPIEIQHRSLILDGALPPNAKSAPPPLATGFRQLRDIQLTPAMVSGYSAEFPHLEGHHDQAAAERIGMRAPIAQGLMGFTLLLAERIRLSHASRFDVEARFTRPIFWDEALGLEAEGDARLRAVNPAGKTVSELQVNAWAL